MKSNKSERDIGSIESRGTDNETELNVMDGKYVCLSASTSTLAVSASV